LVLVADRDGAVAAGAVGVVAAEVVTVPVVGVVVADEVVVTVPVVGAVVAEVVLAVGGIASVVACDALAGWVAFGRAVAPRATAPASNDPAGAAIAALVARIVRRLRVPAEQDPWARRIRCESQRRR
jgi:hypothetical protein